MMTRKRKTPAAALLVLAASALAIPEVDSVIQAGFGSWWRALAPASAASSAGSVQREMGTGRAISTRGAVKLKGVVRTEEGDPIAGASIRVWQAVPDAGHPIAVADSDAAGRFEIEVPRGGSHRLSVEGDGFAAVEDHPRLASGAVVEKDYFLRPATASIRGQVTDELGDPLADVQVGASFGGFFSPVQTERLMPLHGLSDARGNFEITGLAAVKVSLSLQAEGYLPDGTTVPLTEGAVAAVRFQLKKGLVKEFLVTDETGAPVDRAIVISNHGSPFPTDAEGVARVVFPAEEDGTVVCSVIAPGYMAREIPLDLKSARTQVVLEPGPELRGVVLTMEGGPIPDALIQLTGGWRHDEGTVFSDASGRFSIRVPNPRASSLLAAAPGFVEVRLPLHDAAPLEDELEIRLPRPDAGLFGRVVDSEGRPVRLFSVQLREGEKVFRRHFNEASGLFEIHDIPAGSYDILVSSTQPELLNVAAWKEAVAIPSGQTVGELLFRFPPKIAKD